MTQSIMKFLLYFIKYNKINKREIKSQNYHEFMIY